MILNKERFIKVYDRLFPYLEPDKSEDLKWSLDNLEKYYLDEIKGL